MLLACLLAVFAEALKDYDIKEFAITVLGVLLFFGISGYAVTTLMARILIESHQKFYPLVALLLFLAHFEQLNRMVAGGIMDAHGRSMFRIAGGALVLLVTLLLSVASRWIEGRNHHGVSTSAAQQPDIAA